MARESILENGRHKYDQSDQTKNPTWQKDSRMLNQARTIFLKLSSQKNSVMKQAYKTLDVNKSRQDPVFNVQSIVTFRKKSINLIIRWVN